MSSSDKMFKLHVVVLDACGYDCRSCDRCAGDAWCLDDFLSHNEGCQIAVPVRHAVTPACSKRSLQQVLGVYEEAITLKSSKIRFDSQFVTSKRIKGWDGQVATDMCVGSCGHSAMVWCDYNGRGSITRNVVSMLSEITTWINIPHQVPTFTTLSSNHTLAKKIVFNRSLFLNVSVEQ